MEAQRAKWHQLCQRGKRRLTAERPNRKQFRTTGVMTIQIKTNRRPGKGGEVKAFQHQSRQRREGLSSASAGLDQTAGDQHDPVGTKVYAAQSSTTPVGPFSIDRREVGAHDVYIEILYCGVCHSDLHQVRNEWHNTVYPCVPGHEIVGRVVKVGREVKKFKEGEIAAVGCMVDSCRTCSSCRAGYEQYCENGPVLTYNSEDRHLGEVTYGGYSEAIVVDEAFVLRVAANLDPAAVAPLLCAGITTYSPLRHWKVGKGQKVGIVGLGGLGHMAVKFASAFGAHVVLFTTSPNKEADALRLGAHEVVISKNNAEMEKHSNSFNFILDAVSAEHHLNAYLRLF